MHQHPDYLQQLHALVNQPLQVQDLFLLRLDVLHCVLDLHRALEELLLQELLLLLPPRDLLVELKLQVEFGLDGLDELPLDEVVLRTVFFIGLVELIDLGLEVVPVLGVLALLLLELLDVLVGLSADVALVLGDELPHLGRPLVGALDHLHVGVECPIHLHVAVDVVADDLTAQQALISVHHYLPICYYYAILII